MASEAIVAFVTTNPLGNPADTCAQGVFTGLASALYPGYSPGLDICSRPPC